MKKDKFKDFVKQNSTDIFEVDMCPLENDIVKFEKLLDKEFDNCPKKINPIIRLRYWISAAVLIIGVLLVLPMYNGERIAENPDNVEHYLSSLNKRIDILISKVEAIDSVEHVILISDLRQLKFDNEVFIEESKNTQMNKYFIDMQEIGSQQMQVLASLEKSVDNNFQTN